VRVVLNPPPSPPPPPPEPARSPNAIALGRKAWIHPDSLSWAFTTSRGPGGQNVNKVATRAVLQVDPARVYGLHEAARVRWMEVVRHRVAGGVVTFSCGEHRSQLQNREACVAQLAASVRQAEVPPKVRRPTKATRGSRERRLESKKREGEKKKSRGWRE
jgi:ribosome-associated protein